MGVLKRSVLFIIFIFIAGACVVGTTGYVRAGTLDPDSSPAPTMKTLDEVEPRIPISSLPHTITESGSYYLTGNMDVSGTGITVEADDVTIDLMGYTITGDGSSGNGIYMNGRSNVEIRNGTVKTFGQHGIYETTNNGSEHRIIGIRVVGNGSYGIYLNSVQNQVKNCAASGNIGYGISTYAGSTVTNNTAHDNDSSGIVTRYGSTVTNNTAYDNGDFGISAGSGSTVTSNTAYDNDSYGIYTDSGSTVTNNTAYSNGGYGIGTSTGSTVTNNTAYDNGSDGISAGTGSTVTNNTAHDNDSSGIYAYAGSTVTNNTAYFNQNYGIYITADSLVKDNTATYNNRSGGAYTNLLCDFGTCTMSTNHAP